KNYGDGWRGRPPFERADPFKVRRNKLVLPTAYRLLPTMADALREKRVELILQQLEELPTLPAVVVRVLEVTGNEDSSAQEVIELISSDVSLTARILQLVHRADTGVRGDVNSID